VGAEGRLIEMDGLSAKAIRESAERSLSVAWDTGATANQVVLAWLMGGDTGDPAGGGVVGGAA
jgi:hypothetical protein